MGFDRADFPRPRSVPGRWRVHHFGRINLRSSDPLAGFTLIEVLVSVAVLLIVMVVLFQITASIGNIWKASSGKTSAFQNARSAFATFNQTLARATLNTYSDYVSKSTAGVYTFRNAANATTAANFVPTQFARASELHFVSGPTLDLANAIETTDKQAALGSDGTAGTLPGDAVFFQAALGSTNAPSQYSSLNRALNSVGFYVQYSKVDTDLLPTWLKNSVQNRSYHYRLVEFVQPTENLQIYSSTSQPNYLLDWLRFATLSKTDANTFRTRSRVLAEDVILLILRPRLSPKDEENVAKNYFGGSSYDSSQFGSILSPNYHYDSRAWQTGYPTARVNTAGAPALRDQLMCNQLPPIFDIVMICADPQSLARYDLTSATPPKDLLVAAGSGGLFQDSARMEADINTYASQLAGKHIRFHILRSTLEIQGAKWSNN